ncbi:MAG: 50S ribosomal protein L1 [Candidatus Bathyarchaeota archaeon]|jgi:large subunit ribosomal protein L1|nr:50S ribosomal protein L1 [Candidatus Termitimicrobium sp.]
MPLDNKTISEAIKQAKSQAGEKKFNQTIDLILDIQEIDMKAPEGKIQEVVELPHGTLKPNRVCVIASGEFALKAKNAGADRVVDRTELDELNGKKKELRQLANDCNVFIAEVPLMPLVGKILGPVLGPRGKMPIPVPPNADIVALIGKHRKTVVVRMRNQPIIQVRIGSQQMKDEDITDNAMTILRTLDGKLKRGLKNVKYAFIKTSMGEPVKIKP